MCICTYRDRHDIDSTEDWNDMWHFYVHFNGVFFVKQPDNLTEFVHKKDIKEFYYLVPSKISGIVHN